MRKNRNLLPIPVLIFNRDRMLIGICRSYRAAAVITLCNPQAISFACCGKSVICGEYYFRQIHPKIQIEMDDLDKLKLEEYDAMCGESRQYYSVKKIIKLSKVKKQKLQNKNNITSI